MAATVLAESLPSALGYESYADWYTHQWGPTLGLASRLLGDVAAAEDVAAEVLARVWARWEVAGVPRWPNAYLAQATRNAVASTMRRGARERELIERFDVDTHEPDPGDRIVESAAVTDLLNDLPADVRETLEMFYLQDLSAEEIADRLGIEPVSVRSRLCRGRRRLVVAQ